MPILASVTHWIDEVCKWNIVCGYLVDCFPIIIKQIFKYVIYVYATKY